MSSIGTVSPSISRIPSAGSDQGADSNTLQQAEAKAADAAAKLAADQKAKAEEDVIRHDQRELQAAQKAVEAAQATEAAKNGGVNVVI